MKTDLNNDEDDEESDEEDSSFEAGSESEDESVSEVVSSASIIDIKSHRKILMGVAQISRRTRSDHGRKRVLLFLLVFDFDFQDQTKEQKAQPPKRAKLINVRPE